MALYINEMEYNIKEINVRLHADRLYINPNDSFDYFIVDSSACILKLYVNGSARAVDNLSYIYSALYSLKCGLYREVKIEYRSIPFIER